MSQRILLGVHDTPGVPDSTEYFHKIFNLSIFGEEYISMYEIGTSTSRLAHTMQV